MAALGWLLNLGFAGGGAVVIMTITYSHDGNLAINYNHHGNLPLNCALKGSLPITYGHKGVLA